MENNDKCLGLVSVTKFEPATTHEFYFISKETLSISDIVKVVSPNCKTETRDKKKYVYGYIQEIRQLADSESHLDNYVSNRFLEEKFLKDIHSMSNKKISFYCLKVRVIHDESEVYAPVENRQEVYTCNEDEIKKALYINNNSGKENNSGNGILVGQVQMYKGLGDDKKVKVDIEIDPQYLIGPNGSAHLNVSGISGLACKTSYVRYLIGRMQEYYTDKDDAPAYILFNVKGEDLMGLENYECKSENDVKSLLSGNSKPSTL